jgi:hypothetical protein
VLVGCATPCCASAASASSRSGMGSPAASSTGASACLGLRCHDSQRRRPTCSSAPVSLLRPFALKAWVPLARSGARARPYRCHASYEIRSARLLMFGRWRRCFRSLMLEYHSGELDSRLGATSLSALVVRWDTWMVVPIPLRRCRPVPSDSRAPRAADRARVTDHGITGSTEAGYQAGTYAPRGARADRHPYSTR